MEYFKKSTKLADEIKAIEKKIAEQQQKLKELKDKRQREENLEIISMVRNSGLALTDIAEIISSYSEKTSAVVEKEIPVPEITELKGDTLNDKK